MSRALRRATKQMLETGDFIDIRFQDEARHKKPVGIYWLQAATVRAGEALGVPEARTQIWLYRLPSFLGAAASRAARLLGLPCADDTGRGVCGGAGVRRLHPDWRRSPACQDRCRDERNCHCRLRYRGAGVDPAPHRQHHVGRNVCVLGRDRYCGTAERPGDRHGRRAGRGHAVMAVAFPAVGAAADRPAWDFAGSADRAAMVCHDCLEERRGVFLPNPSARTCWPRSAPGRKSIGARRGFIR